MKAIYIDAGHGLGPEGAIDNGASGTVQERDRVVLIAKQVIALLRAQPSLKDVALIPIGVDTRLMLIDHIKAVNTDFVQNSYKAGDALLVSLHCNSGGGTGVESWFETGNAEGEKLAIKTGSVCAAHSGLSFRGYKGDLVNRNGRLGIVRDVKPVAALVECGFVDSDIDAPRLRDTPEKFAAGIVDGIVSYMGIQFVSPTLVFPDVEAGRWSEKDIKFVKDNKLMNGYSDGMFRPAQMVSREELATTLRRFYDLTH